MKIIKSFFLNILVCSLFFSCQKALDLENNLISSGSLAKDNNGDCLPVTVNGIYKANTPLNNTHYIDVSVNVSSPGTYEIMTDTINGIHFGDSAQFTAVGLQIVRLQGYGNPVNAGLFSFTVQYNASSCAVAITVSPAGGSGPATFTLLGAPGLCVSPVIQGTYMAGTPLNASNKIDVLVDVTIPGDYTLSTATVNGFSFSASGTFTVAATQVVTLSGSGTPVAAGTNSMSISGATAGCSFPITVVPAGTITKIKRIIQSVIGSRKTYVTTLTYDASNRLLTFKEWEEDSSFTPIKITSSNYSAFTYNGTGENPIKNTITHETGTTGPDSTRYYYDTQNRVIKEETYSGNHISVRNTFSYLSATIVLLSKEVYTGTTLQFMGTDSLIFDGQKRILETRSYNASNVFTSIASYQYDFKNNPFSVIKLFDYAFTLYGDDAKYFYRSPNNFTQFNQVYNPPSNTLININYTTYNSGLYPLYGMGSLTNGSSTQNFSLLYEYY